MIFIIIRNTFEDVTSGCVFFPKNFPFAFNLDKSFRHPQ